MLFKQANTLIVPDFNSGYFQLHDFIYTEGATVASRNGTTKEILNFKTTVTKPLQRCVAGYKRNTNIFFLLAEALWIFKGRRDLEFLEIFNSNMRNFSDDGKYFHGSYGWRLRHYGISAMQELHEESRYTIDESKDQLAITLEMLHNDPSDRRVVISLWNPDLDLATKSLDLPCNDMLMFKVRNNQLHQTIQNRSNDLNLGLTTNIFQFGFLGEVMAALLGVDYATQTHNSQSLHLYMQHELTTHLQSEFVAGDYEALRRGELHGFDFYGLFTNFKIEFNFSEQNLSIKKKLFWVDFYMHGIILKLLNRSRGKFETDPIDGEGIFESELKAFSFTLWLIYGLLKIYVDYKKHKTYDIALDATMKLISETGTSRLDICVLALNFFMKRLQEKDQVVYKTWLDRLQYIFLGYKNINLGKL